VGIKEFRHIPYSERTDDQKLESNWSKACKQFGRNDWSACVVRVATAAEIAANIYVRQFLLVQHSLPTSYVDALLIGANGLDGKFKRLIRPAAEVLGTWAAIKTVQKRIESLHDHRNGVVHSGKFKNRLDAVTAFSDSLEIVRHLAPDESTKLALPYES
jgi:hypothetical protein